MAGNSFNVPHVLSSATVEGLRAKMLENNLLHHTEFVYYQIVHDTKQFHAFYMKLSDDLLLTQKKKPTKKTVEA